jgi:hypothetical protein
MKRLKHLKHDVSGGHGLPDRELRCGMGRDLDRCLASRYTAWRRTASSPAYPLAMPTRCSAALTPSTPCSSNKAPRPVSTARTGYARPPKIDWKARKMQRLVAATTHMPQRLMRSPRAGAARASGAASRSSQTECARRVARQKVERLRLSVMWMRSQQCGRTEGASMLVGQSAGPARSVRRRRRETDAHGGVLEKKNIILGG